MNVIRIVFLSIIVSVFTNLSYAQIAVTQNSDATQLAEHLGGLGVVISNAVLNCNTISSGTFTGGTALGISDGVVLSSGEVLNIPDISTNMASDDMSFAGDPDLDAILAASGVTYSTNDACGLEFDIYVTGDSLKFDYVFSSEEYTSFVCNGFNDLFGFFISGPNPAGGSYVSQNVALIPGSTTAVAINTVNDGTPNGTDAGCISTNTGFYNGAVTNVVFDGNTVRLTALAATVPCQTYHFKLVVADGGDFSLDSGVFLEAGSFSSNATIISASSVLGVGFDEGVEGCVNGLFNLSIDSIYTFSHWVYFDISGTATNGVDYTLIPDSVLIPAGDSTVSILVDVLTDGITEGTETVIFTPFTICGTLGNPTPLNIVDNIENSSTISDTVLCNPGIITLSASGAQYYTWRDSTLMSNPHNATTNTISPVTESTTFYLDAILGDCSFTDTLSVVVTTSDPTFEVQEISCAGANDGAYWVEPNALAVFPFTYNFIFGPSTDSLLENIAPGLQFVSVVDGLGCTYSNIHTFADPAALVFNWDTIPISCTGANDGSVIIYGIANGAYTLLIDTNGIQYDSHNFLINNDSFQINSLAPGDYAIQFTNDTLGCSGSFVATISEPNGMSYSIDTANISCAGANDGSICIYNVANGNYTANAIFNGVPLPASNFVINNDTFCIDNLPAGLYNINIVNNTTSCNANFDVNLTQPDTLNVEITVMGSGLCAGGTIDSLVTLTTGGTLSYQYLWNDGSVTANISTVPFGIHQIVVTDNNGCMDSASVNIIAPTPMFLEISEDSVLCYGENTGLAYVDSISGGSSPYFYNWNDPNNQTSDTAFNLFAGSIILNVLDLYGCTISDTIEVFQPLDSISLSLSSDTVTCFGGNTCINTTVSGGSGVLSFSWSNGATTANVCGLIAGSYVLTVTDENGCTKIDSIIIHELPEIVLTMDSLNVICYGMSIGSATVNVTGGSGSYTYLWDDALIQTTNTALNLAAGLYTVIVTDAIDVACTKTMTVNIEQPSDSILISLDNIVDVLCNDFSTGEINIGITGGTIPYSYLWSNASINEDLTNVQAGIYDFTVTDFNNCSMSFVDTITQPGEVIISLNTNLISCFGGDTCIEATISGGVSPYTFLWDDALNQTTEDVCGLIAGTYILEVTDDNSCVNLDTITINEVPEIILNMTSTNVLCYGGSSGTATITATGGTGSYTYLWNDALAQTTSIATGLVSGNYSVVVSDINNILCTKTMNVSIIQPSDSIAITLDNIVDVLCFNESTGQINITTTGGTVPYTYLWSDGSNNEDLTNSISGIYTLVVTDDNNCTETIFDTITQPISPLSLTYNTVDVSCFGGNDGEIDISVSGGTSPYTYAWSNSEIIEDITNLMSGTYTITATDANNCTISDNIVINQPTDVLITFTYSDYNGSNVSCNNSVDGTILAAVSGGNSPFSYSWDNGMSGNPISGISANTAIEVTVTDNNSCVYTESISPLSEPAVLTIAKDSISIQCAGDNSGTAIALPNGGTAPYSYLWSNGQTTSSATGLAANTYNCNITDVNGCQEMIQIVITEPLPIVISSISDSVKCWGDEDGALIITATGGNDNSFEYSIDGGFTYQSGTVFTGLASGIYNEIMVRQGGDDGCLTAAVSDVVYQPEPMFIFINPDDITLQLEEAIPLNIHVDPATGYYSGEYYSESDITSISWSPTNGLSCSDCIDPTVLTYEHETEYIATVTYSPYGCITTANAVVHVENNLNFFIPNAFSPQSDGVNDDFRVYGEGLRDFYIVVFNRWGEKMFESNNQSIGWNGMFKGELQDPGVYTYQFEATYLDNKEITLKGSISLIR